jgi:hypothetical protein
VIIGTPALHGMEYVYTNIGNDIIHNFKRITIVIKAQKQMFVRGIIPNIVIYHIYHGVSEDTDYSRAYLTGVFFVYSPERPVEIFPNNSYAKRNLNKRGGQWLKRTW